MLKEHHYGPQVKIFDNPSWNSLLTRLSTSELKQPQLSHFTTLLYQQMIASVTDLELNKKSITTITRMNEFHPNSKLTSYIIDPKEKVAVVALARAGILPGITCYDFLNHILEPENVRQDHIYASRTSDENGHVTGTNFAGSKIGGDIQDRAIFIPDPMGATGSSICATLDHYKKKIDGKAKRYIAMHLIVTPEYLKKVIHTHPDLIVYSMRLDRGLSKLDVLNKELGLDWDNEKGLNENGYIVPGAGGIGELLNNSFV